jgi:hypothetical protein
MLLTALSLALVANSYDPPRSASPRVERVAVASVTILSGEEVSPARDKADDRGSTRRANARQRRVRDGMQMLEFY